MADTQRNVKVRFNGDASDLRRAARSGERAIGRFSKKSEVVTGALRSVGASAVRLGPLLLGVFASLPAIAAVAATGIVLAFGAGLAGIGLAAAAQSKRVKKRFANLKTDVVSELKSISEPFEDTLFTIANQAQRVFSGFSPTLKKSFEKIAPVLSGFVRQFGDALLALEPAIKPMTDAFNAILRQIGPQLKPLFSDIADALSDLAGVVKDNKAEFSLFISGLLRMIPGAIRIIAKLASAFGWIVRHLGPLAAFWVGGWTIMLKAMKGAVGWMLDGFGLIVSGAAKAFGWVPGVGDKLKRAERDFQGFRRGVDRVFDRAIGKTEEWQRALRRMPKVIKLRGRINDLKSKINEAKRRLKTVPKSKRADIRARIRQLQAQVRRARRAINGLPSRKTITIAARATRTVTTVFRSLPFVSGKRATGGSVAAGRSYLVGERGPEVVTMGGNGHVTPNHQLGRGSTEVRVFIGDQELRGMVRTELVEHDRGIKRRALAGVGANR